MKKSKPIQYTYFEKGSIQQHYAVIHGQSLPPDDRVYQTPEYSEEIRQRALISRKGERQGDRLTRHREGGVAPGEANRQGLAQRLN